jgi:hypothetical protein
MAGRSQLPVQIMENQTRYDLNAAIENWRNELAAQPNLASDDRRELETHLRDTIAGFQQRGLNDEESFWLARKRVGQPQQLGEEFVKANPNQIWRERLFWMTVAILVIQLWSQTVSIFLFLSRNYLFSHLYGLLPSNKLCDSLLAILSSESISRLLPLFSFVLIVVIVIGLFQKRLNQCAHQFQSLFKSRSRFLFVFAVFFSVYFLLLLNFALRSDTNELLYSDATKTVIILGIEYAIFPMVLVGLIAWLMPTQNQKTPKCA